MQFNRLTPELIQELTNSVGSEIIFSAPTIREQYSHDHTEDLVFLPDLVAKPQSTAQVISILKFCNEHYIPITPAGGRTGLSGGMLPVAGGILLSTERMNRILEIDTQNLQITVEPGVITENIHQLAAQHGLMYPPDPSSKGSCTIGGNIAHNAGGAHAVKYGITRDFVLALEAVLATGEKIHTGAKVLKNSTGYNLTHLLVGSEGTLAIITQATLKLLPKPKHQVVLLSAFSSATDACAAVAGIFQAGIVPVALEFMERDAIIFGQKYLNINHYDTDAEGYLLIELDGNHLEVLAEEAEIIGQVIQNYQGQEPLYADTASQQAELWRLRRCLGLAVKGTTIYKEEDTVVPRAALPVLLAKVKETGKKYGFKSVCYGHAGDGNLHVNILKGDLSDQQWKEEIPQAIREIFEFVVSLGGTLSGEHGIGYVQKPYLDIAFSATEMALMRSLKQVFDPKGILNPGKILM